jgi:hypothetical protein
MRTFTKKDFLSFFDTFFIRENHHQIDDFFLERDKMSVEDVSKLKIPARLRVKAMTKMMNNQSNHLFMCDCAESLLAQVVYPKPNQGSVEAIHVKRLWFDGKASNDELKKAKEHSRLSVAKNIIARNHSSTYDHMVYGVSLEIARALDSCLVSEYPDSLSESAHYASYKVVSAVSSHASFSSLGLSPFPKVVVDSENEYEKHVGFALSYLMEEKP